MQPRKSYAVMHAFLLFKRTFLCNCSSKITQCLCFPKQFEPAVSSFYPVKQWAAHSQLHLWYPSEIRLSLQLFMHRARNVNFLKCFHDLYLILKQCLPKILRKLQRSQQCMISFLLLLQYLVLLTTNQTCQGGHEGELNILS